MEKRRNDPAQDQFPLLMEEEIGIAQEPVLNGLEGRVQQLSPAFEIGNFRELGVEGGPQMHICRYDPQ